jgi:hypothetical protein
MLIIAVAASSTGKASNCEAMATGLHPQGEWVTLGLHCETNHSVFFLSVASSGWHLFVAALLLVVHTQRFFFFLGIFLWPLELVVNLGVAQAAGISQPGGWVHEKQNDGHKSQPMHRRVAHTCQN